MARILVTALVVINSGTQTFANTDASVCNSNGKLQDGACHCHPSFSGEKCQFQNDGGVLRFVGQRACMHGQAAGDSPCACNAGWLGHFCDVPSCPPNAQLRCPSGEFCSKQVCICNDGWAGEKCDAKLTNPVVGGKDLIIGDKSRFVAASASAMCAPIACLNGGVFDLQKCACTCKPPFQGNNCGQCTTKCPGNSKPNPQTCQCECGDVDKHCYNGGLWDEHECVCGCTGPWDPADHCQTCPLIDCKHGSKFDPVACACKCEGNWDGRTCEECPSETELIINKGLKCDGRRFVKETCSCSSSCEPKLCEHGGHQNPDTCQCECNHGQTRPGDLPMRFQESGGMDTNLISLSSRKSSLSQEEVQGDAPLTFWGGEECTVCKPPPGSNCGDARIFNATTCACDSRHCMHFECNGHGEPKKGACHCQCHAGYREPFCKEITDGQTPKAAALSCKVIGEINPNATNGWFWVKNIQNSSLPREVYCDMSTDGGGWMQLARIGRNMATQRLTADNWLHGLSPLSKDEYILPCESIPRATDSGPESAFVVRITMGKVTDFFKPIKGASLCDMLASNSKHLWAPFYAGEKFDKAPHDAKEDKDNKKNSGASFLELGARVGKDGGPIGPDAEHLQSDWTAPAYLNDTRLADLLGGSRKGWLPVAVPQDGRSYVSYWGGNQGGCCHYYSKLYAPGAGNNQPDQGSWGREFIMHIADVTGLGKPANDDDKHA